ncbi:uncharacterized protein LOC115420122 isoform X2 [Sphaeramia orbicularis]|uniref:uncharacterized protein LOC115420122 isoform X2 n=1 Tax=Sphaeramia orbicularis TaxID=375764 RepID=UPI00118095F0|nr:uncharacterized protein LOC115420122 isoform X2 [Sphaeramia orbicularis]
MDMKMKPIYVSMVMVVMTTLVVSSVGRRQTWTTTGYPGENLTRKMFTLSRNGGRIHFFPPSFSVSPPSSTSITSAWGKNFTTPHPTINTTTTTTTTPPTHPWTTPTPSSRGVSVCLRFLTDSYLSDNFPLFTLSPSRSPLQVDVGISGMFRLSFDSWGHNTIFLKPNVRFWSNMWPNMWTSVCVTVDPLKNVAQLFSGSFMSIRKLIPGQVPRFCPHLVQDWLCSPRKCPIGRHL